MCVFGPIAPQHSFLKYIYFVLVEKIGLPISVKTLISIWTEIYIYTGVDALWWLFVYVPMWGEEGAPCFISSHTRPSHVPAPGSWWEVITDPRKWPVCGNHGNHTGFIHLGRDDVMFEKKRERERSGRGYILILGNGFLIAAMHKWMRMVKTVTVHCSGWIHHRSVISQLLSSISKSEDLLWVTLRLNSCQMSTVRPCVVFSLSSSCCSRNVLWHLFRVIAYSASPIHTRSSVGALSSDCHRAKICENWDFIFKLFLMGLNRDGCIVRVSLGICLVCVCVCVRVSQSCSLLWSWLWLLWRKAIAWL